MKSSDKGWYIKWWQVMRHECETSKQHDFIATTPMIRYLVQHGVFLALVLMFLAGAFSMTSGGCAASGAKGTESTNVLACRIASYGKFQDAKYGVSCVMCTQNPADVDYKAMAQANIWALGI